MGQSHFILSIASRAKSTPERAKSTHCGGNPGPHIYAPRYSGGGWGESSAGYSATAVLDKSEANSRTPSCYEASSGPADRMLLREGYSQPNSQQQQFPSASKVKRGGAALGARVSTIHARSPIDSESIDSESIDDPMPLAYQLRQDWDVQGVRQWVATKKPVEKPKSPAPSRLKGDKHKEKRTKAVHLCTAFA